MNNVTLIGRLTRDLELRYTPGGMAVINNSLAVDRGMSRDKKAQAEDRGEQTADFIDITVWGKTAEILNQYSKKGDRIGITGRLQTSNYKNSNGDRVFKTEVHVHNLDLLESGNRKQKQKDLWGEYDGEVPF